MLTPLEGGAAQPAQPPPAAAAASSSSGGDAAAAAPASAAAVGSPDDAVEAPKASGGAGESGGAGKSGGADEIGGIGAPSGLASDALLSAAASRAAIAQYPNWKLDAAAAALSRRFDAECLASATAFIQAVTEMSEEHDHHANIQMFKGREVLVTLTTTAGGVAGVSEKDFLLADCFDQIPIGPASAGGDTSSTTSSKPALGGCGGARSRRDARSVGARFPAFRLAAGVG